MITEDKKKALQKHLELEDKDVRLMQKSEWNENIIEFGKSEYLVLTEEEADEKAEEYIKDSLWAFKASFILAHANTDGMSDYEYKNCEKAIEKIQGEYCESINALIKILIVDMNEFADDAIEADGRGHFLATYDGYENEEDVNGVTYYIYKQ